MIASIARLLLPAGCLGCGRLLAGPPRPGGAAMNLCPGCRASLRRPPPGCARCGAELPAAAAAPGRMPEGWSCGACRERPPPFERLIAAWSYRPPLDAVIAAYKFGRLDYLGGHLGRAAAATVPELAGAAELVVPVPLHRWRRWRRGYDQAAELARPLAAALGLPAADVLVRRRATRAQSGLGRAARRANPRGAFVVRRGWRCRLAGRRLLLVDDVVTTGATLAAAAEPLLAAGAGPVVAFAAARTPAEPPSGAPRAP